MFETILFLIHGSLILLYGVFLSAALSGIRLNRKNSLILLGISVLLGSFQLIVLTSLSEEMVWKLYPLIVHIPLTVILCLIYKKRIVTVLASVLTVYLCCQSAKWFGVVTYYITQNTFAETQMRICILILGAFIILKFLAPFLSAIFNSETTIVCTFGLIPLVYYLFDYFAIIYTDLWMSNNRVVAEFLPFFLGIAFLFFGIVYYKEYEQRSIRLMLKTVGDKLLLSVKNPTCKKPVFSDGLPVTDKKGNGYGTQSIRYMSERLGGNCQFSFENGIFSLRVII